MIEASFAFALVVVLCTALVFCNRRFPQLGGIAVHGSGPQAIHFLSVPRTGGAAVFAGIIVVSLESAPWALLVAVTFSFVPGLVEDLTRRVSPLARYGFAAIAGALAWTFADVRILRLDLPIIDALLIFPAVSLVLTVFAVASFTHAMNLLDGLHGLSAGTVVIAAIAIALVAQTHGDHTLQTLCWGTTAALSGFLLLNFPWGRIFLGDGGAYLGGTLLACLAILLVKRNDAVSPWFAVAVLAHPTVETLLTVVRRLTLHRAAIDVADARHLHSLLYRRLLQFPRLYKHRTAANALAAAMLLLTNALIATAAVMNHGSTRFLTLLFAAYSVAYLLVWWRLICTSDATTNIVA